MTINITPRARLNVLTDPNPEGLRLHVLRSAEMGDCTRNGISARHSTLTLIGWTGYHLERQIEVSRVLPLPRVARGPFGVADDSPAVALSVRPVFGHLSVNLVPVTYDDEVGHWTRVRGPVMAGGNYAIGDSRLSELIEDRTRTSFYGAVAIHDRIE